MLISLLFSIAIGAVIGYVTNAIAIKMLFRPLNEVRIGRFRLPFTPGILPRQRYALSRNIADMVARQLLSPQVVCERIMRADSRDRIEIGIASFLREVLAADNKGVNAALALLHGALATSDAVPQLYLALVDKALTLASNDRFKPALVAQGRSLVDSLLDTLNPMQRIVIVMGQFDAQIKARMDEIIDKLLASLADSARSDKAQELVRAEVLSRLDGEGLAALVRALLGSGSGEGDLEARCDELASKVAPLLIDALVRAVPQALDRLDVRTMVAERIDSLEMQAVEDIVLSIMKDQFRWINIFGALLGALIGLSQLLVPAVTAAINEFITALIGK